MGVGEQLCPLPHEVVFLPAREDLEVVEGVAVVEEVAVVVLLVGVGCVYERPPLRLFFLVVVVVGVVDVVGLVVNFSS